MFALASAMAYGLSDVVGGAVARHMRAVQVALVGQLAGLLVLGIVAPLASSAVPRVPDLAWGGLSGVGTGAAMAFLFRGLSRGAMSVVVPVSAVGGVALPVLIGATLLGDSPAWLTWIGIAVALPALWMVSRGSTGSVRPSGASLRDGLFASVGIAIQYVALARAGPGSGLWPVLSGRMTAVMTVAVLTFTIMRHSPTPEGGRVVSRAVLVAAAGGAGLLAAVALTAYLFAVRTEYVTVAVVLSSLYPVVPVVLGITAFGERVRRLQATGLVATLGSAVLIAVS